MVTVHMSDARLLQIGAITHKQIYAMGLRGRPKMDYGITIV